MYFLFLLGLVSLFADFVYEGSRSVIGPYLLLGGSSAVFVGFIAGFGEFIGYFLRIVFGYWADKTGKYWLFVIIGYLLTTLSVPLMAFANNYLSVGFWVLLERLGKAIRTPSRDTIISFVGSKYGQGFSFGFHKFLDQLGAILGPLFISFILLYSNNNYKLSFLSLFVPAFICIFLLIFAVIKYPNPQKMEKENSKSYQVLSKKNFWIYTIAVSFIAFGFIDFFLVSYHVKYSKLLIDRVIPLVYSIGMFVDALGALILGKMFDKHGLKVVLISLFISSFSEVLIFVLGNIWIGMILWGLGLGALESIAKAYISNIIKKEERATAFGIFNSIYGLAWFIGSFTIGYLYSVYIFWMITVSLSFQFIGLIIIFLISMNEKRE